MVFQQGEFLKPQKITKSAIFFWAAQSGRKFEIPIIVRDASAKTASSINLTEFSRSIFPALFSESKVVFWTAAF